MGDLLIKDVESYLVTYSDQDMARMVHDIDNIRDSGEFQEGSLFYKVDRDIWNHESIIGFTYNTTIQFVLYEIAHRFCDICENHPTEEDDLIF